MKHSNIEWTDHTFNPWEGCQKVGPGCDNCYAEVRNARFSGGQSVNWGPAAPRRRTSERNRNLPLKWNAEHAAFFAGHGRRQRVFCASLADVFDNAVPGEWRADLFDLILRTPNLDWLLLTKRIGNVHGMLPPTVNDFGSVYPNVWLGATIVNQEEADRDIPKLLQTPAAVRFLSMEPLLGPVALPFDRLNEWNFLAVSHQQPHAARSIDWVIVGGESGPHARPMHPEWPRSLRDRCSTAGVPFFFKQWGEWLPTDCCTDATAMLPARLTVYVNCHGNFHDGSDGIDFFNDDQKTAWVGKKAAGRLLDGQTWSETPTP